MADFKVDFMTVDAMEVRISFIAVGLEKAHLTEQIQTCRGQFKALSSSPKLHYLLDYCNFLAVCLL